MAAREFCICLNYRYLSDTLFITYGDLAVLDVDQDDRITADMAVKDRFRQNVDEFLLHEALDRSCSICRLIALGAHVVFKVRGEFYGHTVLRQLRLKVADLHPEDFADISLRERLEHYHLVDSVEELRTDSALEDFQNLIAAVRQESLTGLG